MQKNRQVLLIQLSEIENSELMAASWRKNQSWHSKALSGACKFGCYEFFKKYYSDIAGPEYASKYKTLIYLAGSPSAGVIVDVALCPFEAVKVRVQTQPGFARGLADGLPKFVKYEGTLGYAYKRP